MNDVKSELVLFLIDASKFVTTFKDPISYSTPHIYLSALPFSPEESWVSRHYYPFFSQTVTVDRGRAARWPACVLRLDGHSGPVISVAFSPDNKLIATGSRDYAIIVWDVETGDIITGPLDGHSDFVCSVNFSPDCKQVLSASADKTIRLWDVCTGNAVVGPLEGHTDQVLCAVFSPDGKHIISGSRDMTIRLWYIQPGAVISAPPLYGHTGAVESVVFLGRRVVSSSEDHKVRLWNLDTGDSELLSFEGYDKDSFISDAKVSPDGTRVIYATFECTYHVQDVETGDPVCNPYTGYSSSLSPMAFSAGNKRLAGTRSEDYGGYRMASTIKIVDPHSGRSISEKLLGHAKGISCMAFSPDDKFLVSGSWDYTARVWEVESYINQVPLEDHSIGSWGFSPTGNKIVSGLGQSVRIWDAKTGDAISAPFEGHTSRIISAVLSLDEMLILSVSVDGTLRVWDTQTGNAGLVSNGSDSYISCATFSPDRGSVAMIANGALLIRDTKAGDVALNAKLDVESRGSFMIVFSSDGKFIASGHHTHITILDVETGDIFAGPFSEGYSIYSVAFSPDSKYVVSGSTSHCVRIWDVRSGALHELPVLNYSDGVNCAVFSPDGKRVVAGYKSKTIQVWDIETATTIVGPLIGHGSEVRHVAFSPDGRYVASSSSDQTIRMWDVAVDYEGSASHPANAGEWPDDTDLSHDGFTDKSRWLDHDGWIVNSQGELLFWVPTWIREKLWWPRNTAIIGTQYTKLNLGRFVHGTSWQQCKVGST
jgi:WD40 repeat protein